MSQPKTNMVGELVDLVKSNWPEDVDDSRLIVAKSDDIGKGRDLGTYDYIEMSQTSPLGIPYADLFRSSQNVNTVVYVELKSSNERRREELFAAFRSIVEAHDTRPDTPGDHDGMMLEDITPLDDENFGAYLIEMVVSFESFARKKGV